MNIKHFVIALGITSLCLLLLVLGKESTHKNLMTNARNIDGASADQIPVYTYPADTAFNPVAMPSLSRPTYLSPIVQNEFGTTITRIADQSAMGTSNTTVRHVYSKMQPWNSDSSLILLSYTKIGYILDGKTYKLIRTIDLSGSNLYSSGTASDARWSSTKPTTIYSALGNQFISIDALTGSRTTLHTFSEFTAVSSGLGEGNLSDNDRYASLFAKDSSNHYWVIVYDVSSDVVVSKKDFGSSADNNSNIDWISMSPSGKYVLINWFTSGNRRVEQYDTNLTFVRKLAPLSEHADIGYDSAGKETYVTLDYDKSDAEYITSYPLDGSTPTVLLKPYWNAQHVSCRNNLRPGWCYISDGKGEFPSKAGNNETYALKLDGSGTVEHFAHNYGSNISLYEHDAMSVPDREGKRVMFGSDWLSGSSGPFYSYVAGKVENFTVVAPTNTPSLTVAPLPNSSATPISTPVSQTVTPTPATPAPTKTPLPSPYDLQALVNKDFEEDVDNDGDPDGWTDSSHFSRTSSNIHSGLFSGKHYSTSDTSYTVSSNPVKGVQTGHSYTFSVWTNILPTTDSFTYKYEIRWLNSKGKTVTTSTVKTYTNATAGWEQSVITVIAPSQAVQARVRMNVSSLKGTIYVDGMSLK